MDNRATSMVNQFSTSIILSKINKFRKILYHSIEQIQGYRMIPKLLYFKLSPSSFAQKYENFQWIRSEFCNHSKCENCGPGRKWERWRESLWPDRFRLVRIMRILAAQHRSAARTHFWGCQLSIQLSQHMPGKGGSQVGDHCCREMSIVGPQKQLIENSSKIRENEKNK